jgi:hypothetical protein
MSKFAGFPLSAWAAPLRWPWLWKAHACTESLVNVRLGSKTRKAQSEQIFAALHPESRRTSGHPRSAALCQERRSTGPQGRTLGESVGRPSRARRQQARPGHDCKIPMRPTLAPGERTRKCSLCTLRPNEAGTQPARRCRHPLEHEISGARLGCAAASATGHPTRDAAWLGAHQPDGRLHLVFAASGKRPRKMPIDTTALKRPA